MKPGDSAIGEVDYESTPLSRSEYIAAIVHLYRGELARATDWRMRLDNTTNWAVLTTAGILSLSFRDAEASHLVLLVGFALITVFWAFESRRFRFADVWYSRVRKIEENFYGPILRRNPVSPEMEWGDLIADDLFRPRFKITRLQALRARLLRNYWALYLVQFLAWCLKVAVHPRPAETWQDVQVHLQMGLLAWWLPMVYVGGFLLFLLTVIAFVGPVREHEDHWNVSP